ncbi:MAG: flagellar biosynthesis regulator FlaF [Candidatus Eisenbacteria bacterium]|nr:flagellar biosynthesis regulator FlaF [Candidatus Eisenbacteria bacterium]
MFRSPVQAYEAGSKTSASSRELEAAALFKAARSLETCKDGWNEPQKRETLDDALRQNLRLWSLFQAELARPDHELPLDLRVDLLRLSAFVDRRTFDLMAHPEPEKLQALIDINRHIASGLAATPS